MNDIWILKYRTRTYKHIHTYIYINIKGKDTKIDLKSSLVMLVKKRKPGTTQEFHKISKGSV
jgi:hypothetical protein